MRRIVIAGAHGFMGTRFAELYREAGDTVTTVGRRDADAVWGDTAAITRLVDGADVLVNLAGKSVNCRYTESNKAEIFRSRLETTAELGRAVAAADTPPPLWLNASTATIYRHADDRPQTEAGRRTRPGLLGRTSPRAGRRPSSMPHATGVRQVAMRTAITLGDGSALTPLVGSPGSVSAARNSAARVGARHQRFSWVHLDDVFRGDAVPRDQRPRRCGEHHQPEPVDESRGDGDAAARARGAVRHPTAAHRCWNWVRA